MATASVKRYRGEEHFIDGYVPQSMNAEYSSLHRSTTWLGMGLILASLAAWGTAIFGGATLLSDDKGSAAHTHGVVEFGTNAVTQTWSDFNGMYFFIGGLVLALVMDIVGVILIKIGRRAYKAYRKEFGGAH